MKRVVFKASMICLILACSLFLVFLLQRKTLSSVNDVSEQTALSLLSENAIQVQEVLDNQMENIWQRMEMVADAVTTIGHLPADKINDAEKDEAIEYLKHSMRDAYCLQMVTDDGAYINQDGEEGYIELSNELTPLFLEQQRISILYQQGHDDTLLFGMPMNPVIIGNKRISYLFGYFHLDSFMELLSMESFAGNGKIRVINNEGLVVLHTDNMDEISRSYYFFKMFESAEFFETGRINDFESFKTSLMNGENHAIRVRLKGGENRIISYAKPKCFEWYVTIMVDYESVLGELDKGIKSIGKTSIFMIMIVMIIDVLLVAFISIDVHKVRIEKKKLEELNLSLEQAKSDTEEALTFAKSANRAKSQFLSNMSHDIRTPMNAVIGYTTLAIANIDNREKLGDYLSKILSSGNHLLSLINDVLDMSRIESGKIHIEEEEANLSDILYDIKTIISGQLQAKKIVLYLDTVDLLNEEVYCDKTHLNQVLMNLLSNAVKFTPEGGLISIKMSQLPSNTNDKGLYEISVRDTGIGMSQEFADRIFEPFERESTSTVSRIQGTGLGMTIIKNIIDMMGGTIEVHTKQGKGTEFIVRLEMRLQKKHIGSDESKKPCEVVNEDDFSACLAGRRVLLVEDNEFNREIAMEVLKGYGMIVETVENGMKAVGKISGADSEKYDLVLMDIHMPVMNGYEAARHIRALDCSQTSVPIIAMTANAFEEDKKAALEAGMDRFISKPIDFEKLYRMMVDFFRA